MKSQKEIIEALERRRFEETSAAEGLRFLFQLVSGQHRYSIPETAGICWPRKHPFTMMETSLTLIGNPGATSSIGPFTRKLIEDFALGVHETYELTIFLCETEPGSKQYQIYFQDGWGNLCGGCTNYSGEGGEGTRLMISLFLLLNEIFGVPIEIKKVDHKTWKAGEKLIREAQQAWCLTNSIQMCHDE